MKKKSLAAGILCYVLWGLMAIYWKLLSGTDPMFILVNRIIWSCVFTGLYLAVTGRWGEIKPVLKNRRAMLLLGIASAIITVNWGLYIWAVNSGHILDTSLGYYLNPLVVFVCGMLFFKEKCGPTELIAIALAALGVLFSTLQLGAFPYIALSLALLFSTYGLIKKVAHVDGVVSIFIETLLITPFAILYALTLGKSGAVVTSVSQGLLLVGAGVMTSVPLILYTDGVNGLPFITMGFLQYTSPTLLLLTGVLIYGEPFTSTQAISFALIWLGLAVFSYGTIKSHRAQHAGAGGH